MPKKNLKSSQNTQKVSSKKVVKKTSPKKKKTTKKKVTKKSKAKKMFLSVSRVNLFEQCPQKYYYRYILKLPDPSTYHSAAGSFIHKVLENLVIQFIKAKDLRKAATYAYSLAKKDKEILELGELITPEVCEEVKQWVKDFVKMFEDNPEKMPTFLKAETRFNFHIENTDFMVTGFIDRIDRLDADTVRVIDYKTTGKPSYLKPFQLATYSIPVQKMYPGKKILTAYELVRSDFKQKVFEVTDQDRKNVLDKFVDVGTEIKQLQSNDDPELWKPKPSVLCNYCPYRVRCSKDNKATWS